ncbi:signal peptidase II [Streptomyces iakyrus]|uniref:Lipoprotein signal peptidase n=1 Tax=Streptomyces sp. SID7499 TaxID=2706086 RepID=A0A6G3WVC2_9ACTN|nr:lipoprotein signal peptidase [Streptomyces sp. SID7499]
MRRRLQVTPASAPPGAGRRRAITLAAAALLAALDLAAKAWANHALPGAPVEGGLLDLQLAFNSGAAFSLGASAPTWTLLTVTGAVTAAVAVLAWRAATTMNRAMRAALAAILGGAAANLIDRAADGVVTDYLAAGWWPTFNLADVFIVTGGIIFAALSSLGRSHDPRRQGPTPGR